MPYFVIGMSLLVIFATGLGWFPTSGMLDARGATTTSDRPARATSPGTSSCRSTTVALGLIGQYSILMRSSVIETLGEDYVTTARAKGLTDDAVLRGHALPNALLPAVTLVAINLGYVVGRRDHGRDRLQLAGPRAR